MEQNSDNFDDVDFDAIMEEIDYMIEDKKSEMFILIEKIYMNLKIERHACVDFLQLPDGTIDKCSLTLYHSLNNHNVRVAILGIIDEITVLVYLPIECEPAYKIIVEAIFNRLFSYAITPPGIFCLGKDSDKNGVVFHYNHILLRRTDEVEYFAYKLYECLRYIDSKYLSLEKACTGIFTDEERKSHLMDVKSLAEALLIKSSL